MAYLDVSSELLVDPEIVSSYVVLRRTETVDGHGRVVKGDSRFKGMGVVTAISPSSLERHEGYQEQGRAISVVTQDVLRSATTGYQPDLILWRGSQYVIKAIDLYPQFGPGFYQVEAVSMEHTDSPTVETLPGSMAFNQASNSMLINVR